MNLDELMGITIPRISRLISSEPKEGYNWEPFHFIEGGHYVEGDDLYRERVKATYASHEWRGPTHGGPTRAPE